jgi:hypothetical protein
MTTEETTVIEVWASKEVAEALQVPFDTLVRWARRPGLLNVARIPGPGGHGRTKAQLAWTERDIGEAHVVRNLRGAGSSFERVEKVLVFLRGLDFEWWQNHFFLTVDNPRDADGGVAIYRDGESMPHRSVVMTIFPLFRAAAGSWSCWNGQFLYRPWPDVPRDSAAGERPTAVE